MVVPLYVGLSMIPSQMKMNLFLLLGTMMLTSKPMVYATGGTTSPNADGIRSWSDGPCGHEHRLRPDTRGHIHGFGPGDGASSLGSPVWSGPLGYRRNGHGDDAVYASNDQEWSDG